MAEENQEKKKPGIVRRILKWIGLGLLTLLLIVALIFQAPWKVITVLVIVLLACTLLPRPARKWFWCAVGVVVIALIIWVFLPDSDSGDWRPYTFDDELAALEAKRAIPDSENAAIIYSQLLKEHKDKYEKQKPEEDDKISELMKKGKVELTGAEVNELAANPFEADPFYPDFWDYELDDLTRKESWSSKDYPEIAEWLQTHKGTITTLLQASKMEKCRFPIAADPVSLDKSMERLASMRRWAFLLTRAANNDIGDDRVDQAIEKYIAVLQMARHQYQQPLIVELLVGLSVEALATKQLNRFVIIGNPTNAHLTIIEETLAKIKHDWSYDLPRILECEKLIGKNTVCSSCFQINPKGKVRLSHDPTAAIRATLLGKMPSLTYWQKRLTKVGIILAWFSMPSTPQKFAKIVDAAYERYYAMAQPDYDWQKGPKKFSLTSVRFNYRCMVNILACMSEEVYYRIHDKYVRTIAKQRGSRIIILLRRHKNKNGHWPESLEDIRSLMPAETLVDPFNNGPFVYKLTDESFTLYSKGKNNIDENGEYVSIWPKPKPDDWLIWPEKTKRTEEVNKNDEQ